MGISGRALRQIEASLAIQKGLIAADLPVDDEIETKQESSYFANARQMDLRKYYQTPRFISGCDFTFGPNGSLRPIPSGEC